MATPSGEKASAQRAGNAGSGSVARPAEPAEGRPPPRPEALLALKVCDPALGSGAFLVEACRQLGDELVASWRYWKQEPELRPEEDVTVHARRLVARNCLYGVDRNPIAVDLAKLSLWLATLAKDQPLTFLDHALRHGDSLVGLTPEQIAAFHWKAGRRRFQAGIESAWIGSDVKQALALRRAIQDARDDVLDDELRDRLDRADHALLRVKRHGDLALAAFFEASKAKEREELRRQYATGLQGNGLQSNEGASYDAYLKDLRHRERPLAPFHWEVEFPEVFLDPAGAAAESGSPESLARPNPGFDAVIGNPPFGGKNTVANSNVPHYLDWLKELHPRSHGNADLVAQFFRRAFGLLREGGALGLIATNTISQGDTRATGLRVICKQGGAIFHARPRYKWPGMAAVIVSVVHIWRGEWAQACVLDGRAVGRITAFLLDQGGHDDPARLQANAGQSFVGSYVLGMGFTFDDEKSIASPLAEMERLIAKDPRNRDVIQPYIGGSEVNTSPTQSHHRYVINFRDWPLRCEDVGMTWGEADEARKEEYRSKGIVPLDYPGPAAAHWPDLLKIVEERVKPARDVQKRKALRERWWHYAEKRPGLTSSIANLDRVLAISEVTSHHQFAFLPTGMVYAHRLKVFPFSTHAAFAALQSRPHEIWARFFGSTLKDDICYTPSDCFQTFPFPRNWTQDPALEAAGHAYDEHRARLMVRNKEGLTKTYNRFHDRNDRQPDIIRLRELHAQLDRAMLAAWGWDDLQTTCDFLPDREPEEGEPTGKQKLRYRWPDNVQNKLLARLLDLNAKRAAEERKSATRRS